MLNGIDSSIGSLDDDIQGDEGGLKTGQLDQHADGLLVVGLQPLQLLTSLGKTG